MKSFRQGINIHGDKQKAAEKTMEIYDMHHGHLSVLAIGLERSQADGNQNEIRQAKDGVNVEKCCSALCTLQMTL
jgi:hypothetical protein